MSFQPSLASWVRVSHSVGDLFGSRGVELSFPLPPSHQIETKSLPGLAPEDFGKEEVSPGTRLGTWTPEEMTGTRFIWFQRGWRTVAFEKNPKSGFLEPFLFNLLEQRCAGEQKQCLLLAQLGK